jgi:2-keto-3-deoxy-L-rhamnonate aldolase RhmA
VIGLLETREGVEAIDEICATPGIDGIWVGPADLSLAFDVPGDLGSLAYAEAEDRVVAACLAHGMPFAIGSAGTPSAAQAQIRRGCFTLLADDEVTLLGRAVADYVREVRGILGIGAGGN